MSASRVAGARVPTAGARGARGDGSGTAGSGARGTGAAKETVSHFSAIVGRSRFIVVLAVLAVMLVAVSLFLLGTWKAGVGVYHAWEDLFLGRSDNVQLTVEFLEIVSLMLKAVVFYIIGVGLWSLFVAPLNITVSLGVQTLSDLESKVVSVVVVILGVTFLEHFIRWKDPLATLQFGTAMALVVAALVFFQRYAHQAKEDQKAHDPDEQTRAQQALFEREEEEHVVADDLTHREGGRVPDR